MLFGNRHHDEKINTDTLASTVLSWSASSDDDDKNCDDDDDDDDAVDDDILRIVLPFGRYY